MSVINSYFHDWIVEELIAKLKGSGKESVTTGEMYNLYVNGGKGNEFFENVFDLYLETNADRFGLKKENTIANGNSKWTIV